MNAAMKPHTDGDAEGHPIGVGSGEAHDQPGDALVELLLDDGHRQHQRAHDEQHRIGHQALGHVRGVEPQQQHLADDDEQRHGGQRHRLGDEQKRRHQRHGEHHLAVVAQALRGRQLQEDEADQHGDEEPALFPEVIDVDLAAQQQPALVADTPEAREPLGSLVGLQTVAAKLEGDAAHDRSLTVAGTCASSLSPALDTGLQGPQALSLPPWIAGSSPAVPPKILQPKELDISCPT
jgi:hypothetical protein